MFWLDSLKGPTDPEGTYVCVCGGGGGGACLLCACIEQLGRCMAQVAVTCTHCSVAHSKDLALFCG